MAHTPYSARQSGEKGHGKGLRHFSQRVCEKVRQKGNTTYNEVGVQCWNLCLGKHLRVYLGILFVCVCVCVFWEGGRLWWINCIMFYDNYKMFLSGGNMSSWGCVA